MNNQTLFSVQTRRVVPLSPTSGVDPKSTRVSLCKLLFNSVPPLCNEGESQVTGTGQCTHP